MKIATAKSKSQSKGFSSQKDKGKKPFHKEWPKKDEFDGKACNDLHRKKLCFSCKEPWKLGRRGLGKGNVHYIEVVFDNEEEEKSKHIQGSGHSDLDNEQLRDEDQPPKVVKHRTITTLSGKPRFNSFKLRGVLQGQQLIVLVDSGATHNFIDSTLIAKRGIQTEDFEGF